MKYNIKTLTAIVLLSAFHFAISAQQSILIFDLQPLLADHDEIEYPIVLTSETDASGTYLLAEKKMALEDWMITRDNWTNTNALAKDLSVKEWMLKSFSMHESRDFLTVDAEPPLKVENWMLDSKCWCK